MQKGEDFKSDKDTGLPVVFCTKCSQRLNVKPERVLHYDALTGDPADYTTYGTCPNWRWWWEGNHTQLSYRRMSGETTWAHYWLPVID